MKAKIGLLAGLIFCALTSAVNLSAQAAEKADLHRVDMQVLGSSCAACLIRLEKKLKAEKGVVKVVVSIFKPFKSAIIFDASRTNWKKINQVLAAEKVRADKFRETTVGSVPLVLEPE